MFLIPNTLLSALLFNDRNPRKAFQGARARGELLLSTDVANELGEVLRRDKFDRYIRKKTREEFLRTLIQTATFVNISETIQKCRDSKDDKFLELVLVAMLLM